MSKLALFDQALKSKTGVNATAPRSSGSSGGAAVALAKEGKPPAKIIKPGNAAESKLYQRLGVRSARELVDKLRSGMN